MARDASFAHTFQVLWEEGEPCANAYEELERLKSALFAAKSAVLRRRATVKGYKLDAAGQLAVGVKLLRLHAAAGLTRATVQRYTAKYVFLRQCCDGAGELVPDRLRAHLNGLFSQNGTPAPSDPADDVHLGPADVDAGAPDARAPPPALDESQVAGVAAAAPAANAPRTPRRTLL